MTKHSKEEKLKAFSQLLDVVDTLREQCPWDSAQTNESIRPNTIEETMELAEALIAGEPDNIRKELGDVLLHILFYARFGEEKSQFDIADVCDSLREKLIFRHPHIYGDHRAADASQVREQWEEAANVGFDWDKPEDVWQKVREEIGEVEAELKSGHEIDREKEFGDLFFSLVNAARLYGVRPDNALEKTNRKFIGRFNYIEQKSKQQGKRLNEMTLAEMDQLWDEAKKQHLGE